MPGMFGGAGGGAGTAGGAGKGFDMAGMMKTIQGLLGGKSDEENDKPIGGQGPSAIPTPASRVMPSYGAMISQMLGRR